MLMAASGLHAFFIPSNSHKHSVSTVYAATDKDEPKDQDYRKYDSKYENLRCGSMKDLHPQSFKEKERDQLHYMEREWDTDQNRCRLWEKETVKEQEREKKRVRASDADKIEKERIHARKAVDREPGELSSGSLSEDGGGMSDYDVNLYSNQHAADGEVQKPGCGSSTPKQRKYSPIVWDLDDKPVQSKSADVPGSSMVGVDASKMSAEKMSLNRRIIGSPLHSAEWVSPLFYPSLPPSPSLTSPFSEMWQGSQDASVACQMPLRSVGGRLSRPFGLEGSASLSSPPEQHHKVLLTGAGGNAKIENTDVQMQEYPGSPVLGDEQESQQLQDRTESNEKEEALLLRHIAASRWADLNNSPEHASFLEDEGILKVWKHSISVDSKDSMVFSQSGGNQGSGLIMSPEPAEHASERLEHGQGRSRTDNGECKDSGGSSVREFQHTLVEEEEDDQKLNHNKLMELDEEDNAQNHSHKQHPELDSDGEQSPTTQSSSSPSPQRIIDMLQGCRSVDEYERLNRIDEGTYGVVYRARNKKTGEIVALKKVKMDKDKEEFPMTSLREINVLLSFHHPSVVDVKEVVVGSNLDSIFMVMEYMEHDLKALLETMKHPFSESEVKCLMLQLLEGVKYLHDNWVLHRDLKTSNLLLNNKGELKICDFGLARQYGSPLKPYTNTVVTLWYRAPELLLGAKQYSTAIDMWSVGCIMAELLAKGPLFNGKSEITQLDKIFRTLGTPNEKIWPNIVTLPGVKFNFSKHPYNNLREKFPLTSFSGKPTLSESGFDLLNRLLTYDPSKRVTAEEALKHKWFSEVPLPKSKDFMPTYPARNDHDRRKMRLLKSPDPLEEQRIRELQQGDLGTASLFG